MSSGPWKPRSSTGGGLADYFEPSDYVVSYFARPENRQRLARIFGVEELGDMLGCGAFGCVYEMRGPWVLKVTGDGDEAFIWEKLRELKHEHDLVGVPEIERVVWLDTKDGERLGGIVREELAHKRPPQAMLNQLDDYQNAAKDFYYYKLNEGFEDMEAATAEMQYAASRIARMPRASGLGTTLAALANIGIPPADLHAGNIGEREHAKFGKRGEYVLLDPGSVPTAHAEIRETYVANMRSMAMRRNDRYSPFEEHLRGGAASGMRPEDFDEEALIKGIAHELEHTDDEAVAMEIAMDHLAKDGPLYYDKLEAMEEGDMETLERLERTSMAANRSLRDVLEDPLDTASVRVNGREDEVPSAVFDETYHEMLARGMSPESAAAAAAAAAVQTAGEKPFDPYAAPERYAQPHHFAVNAQCPDGTEVQTLLFSRDAYSPSKAKAWAKSHGYHHGKVDTTEQYHRVRQHDPAQFKRGSFRTISFGPGIKAVIGCPR